MGPRRAVQDVTFSIARGEVLAFLGPNGAGKTTTIKMSAGLIRPDAGKVRIGGIDLWQHHDPAVQQMGAVLEGSRNLYWRMTVMENLLYWGAMRGITGKAAKSRAQELLDRVGLGDRARSQVQSLSRGMQQKASLCQALMTSPQVLLLDEPTLGLDYEAAASIKSLVRELAQQGTAILLTTHQLDIAQELSDRIAIIRQGQLVLQGTTSEVLQQYSQPLFAIEGAEPWPLEILERVRGVPGSIQMIDPLTLLFVPEAADMAGIYDLIAALSPHPIARIQRHQADLSEVVQKVLTEGATA